MEFTFVWFWVIKLFLTAIILYVIYIAIVKYKLKNKYWSISAVILIILSIIAPIKINGTNSTSVIHQQNYSIEQTKNLPPKVVDTSFNDNAVSNSADITHQQIWK